jgi:hypothetical protein
MAMIVRAFEILFLLALFVPPVVVVAGAIALAVPRRRAARTAAPRHAHATA